MDTTCIEKETPCEKPVKTRKKRAPKHDFKDGRGRVPAHRHDNGGGWVADTAKVDDTVYVGRTAQIADHAIVRDAVKISGAAVVKHAARVSGTAQITHDAKVTGMATVTDNAKIRFNGRVGGRSIISGASFIGINCAITGGARILDSQLYDHVVVGGAALIVNSTLSFALGWRPTRRDSRRYEEPVKRLTIQGDAKVYGATLRGNVYASDRATILDSTIANETYYEFFDAPITLRHSCCVMYSEIRAPLKISGEALLSHVMAHSWTPNSSADRSELWREITSGKIIDLRINSVEEWDRTPWDPASNPAYVQRTVANTTAADLIVASSNRRVQRV